MRGRVTAALFLLLSLSPNAFPQCSWTPRVSGQFRATVLDVATDGAFVWTATSYGVQLLDGTTVVDSIALPGATRVVVADGNGYAYAGSGSRVYALRRNGSAIEKLGAADAGAPVNDLALVSTYIFAATSTGIAHFDRFDPANPTRTSVSIPSSSPNVTSLAVSGQTLYAADGDATIEVYSISVPALPQRTGSIESVARATSVHASPEGLLFVSDKFGQNTDIFSGTTRLTRLSLGATSFASSPSAQFVAGPDRTLRAIDVSTVTNPVELFEHQLAPTGGSDNAIHALARSGNTLYVAAGDIGLVTFDITSLGRPHAIASYSGGATTSVLASGTKGWFTEATGHIAEVTIDGAGVSLTRTRTWTDVANGSSIRDLRGDILLTTASNQLTRWNLTAQPPTPTTATLNGPAQGAVLTSSGFLALLANGTLVSETGNVTLGFTPSAIARSGDAIALTEIRAEERKTILHYFQNGIASETRSVTIDGAAIGNIALDATRAALFTFNGINVIDLAGGNTRVIEGSNRAIPRQLAFAGDDLLATDGRTLYVYDDARTLMREHELPADAVAISGAAPYALAATNEGMLAAQYLLALPTAATRYASRFPTKLVLGGPSLVLFGADGIDVYSTVIGDMPAYASSIRSPGAIDVAATADRIFTLAANGTVTAYSHAGVALAQKLLDEGSDAQPLAIATAGNAVWVAFSVGCQTSGCAKKTLVLDPGSLVTTSTMTGGVVDVVTSAARAYALFDMPDEARVLDLADPLHPSAVATTAAPASATSIAAGGGKVYIAGDKAYVYNENTLAASGTQLAAVTPAASQRIRIDGGCAVIIGRGTDAEAWVLPGFDSGGTLFETPSNLRAIAADAGRLYFLTEHSLEVWSARPANPPSKRRSTR